VSDAEDKKGKRPNKEEPGPTISFDRDVLGPSAQLGQFRIEHELGRGGMGVVYLAHDTKLDRKVAIKSLPAEVVGNPEILSRLKREAKILASLNHRNIAAIYDELEADDKRYLILEYVAGDTLTERIKRGAVPWEKALSIALQVAEGLYAAHNRAVIHRDLKPGNIKITDEENIKLLDFGIAKAVRIERPDDESNLTKPGKIIGTPVYMSPEQVRGEVVDHRSDIWSFGCVLFEMLTGKVPFAAKTSSDVVANILKQEPDWQSLPSKTPANIRVLLRRCLEKDRQRRLQHIGDAVIEIQETLNLPPNVPPQTTTLAAVSDRSGWPRLAAATAAGVILSAIVIGIVFWVRGPSESLQGMPAKNFIIYPKTDLALEGLWHHALAFSPDGGLLAYIEQDTDGRRRIYLRSMDSFEAIRLPGTEGAISPFFSADGQWVAYVDHFQRVLKKVSIKGGDPIVLAECTQFRGGSWGPDDRIVFTPTVRGGLWRISASGEGLEELTSVDPNIGENGHHWPQILPDGKHVLFTNRRVGGIKEHQIEIYSLETGKRSVLFKGGSYARYVSTGHIFYGRSESLYAVAFDLSRQKVSGSHVPVVPDVITTGSGSAQFAFARDGSLAYLPVLARHTELEPVLVTRDGNVTRLAMAKRNYHSVSVSPDGVRVSLMVEEGGNSELWIYDSERRTANRLTNDFGTSNGVWTPDSRQLIYASSGTPTLYRQDADGASERKVLAKLDRNFSPTSCSPDGLEVLIVTSDPNRPKLDEDIWVVSLDEEGKARSKTLIERPNNQRHGVWSPDGKWMAYSSDESGAWEVYVEPYPGTGPKTRISMNGGYQPVWSRDGGELFYRGGRKIVAATIETAPQFKVVSRKELFEGKYMSCLVCQTYDASPDGEFLMIQDPKESPPQGINVVLNWFEELKRLVPTGKD
jgi:serine/threonine protein kinase/Tol biopolymer transport system component